MLASHFYAMLRRRSGSLKGMRMIEMNQLQSGIVEAASKVRANNPMAGSITNSVTIDFVANAQLAVGGSAAMVYLPDEGECLVAAGGAVYINMGTLLPVYEETLPRTAAAAHAAGKPWVLDPVGIGIGSLRTKLLRGFKPYKPAIVGAHEPRPGEVRWRMGGNCCLAGDYKGDWAFDTEPSVGDRVVFEDMIHYTMVKTTMFNGVSHPSIAIVHENGKLEVVKRFGYRDFRDRMS